MLRFIVVNYDKMVNHLTNSVYNGIILYHSKVLVAILPEFNFLEKKSVLSCITRNLSRTFLNNIYIQYTTFIYNFPTANGITVVERVIYIYMCVCVGARVCVYYS